jgi:hypothetical protein
MLYDRIKYRQQDILKRYSDKKYYIPGFFYISHIIAATLSSGITLLLTYPFDNAFARAACNFNYEKRYLKLQDCFISYTMTQQSALLKYYSGFSFAVVQAAVHSSITLLCYQGLSSYIGKKYNGNEGIWRSYMEIFGWTSLIGLFASTASYPFDTMKRRFQLLSMIDPNTHLQSATRGGSYYVYLI